MPFIYVPYRPEYAPCGLEYAELEDVGWAVVPVHPGRLPERVGDLVTGGRDFATVSSLVFDIIGALIRRKQLRCGKWKVIVLGQDGRQLGPDPLSFAADGEFIQPWPERGSDSLFDALFHHRYGD